jgi:hypothetical protein
MELEAALSENMSDIAFLESLHDELSHRSTERAKNLMRRIDEILLNQKPKVNQAKPDTGSQTLPIKPSIQPFSMNREAMKKVQEKVEREKRKKLLNNPLDILHSWTALEVLNPKVDRQPDKKLIASLKKNALPWDGEGEKSLPNRRLFYEIVLGTIDVQKPVAALLEIYADKRVDRPAVKGKAFLASIMVDRTGKIVGNAPIAVSSFGWGVPKALQGELSILSTWQEAERTLLEALGHILIRVDDEG